MRLMKQLSAVVTVVAVLALPLGMMGCAKEAATPSGGADGAGAAAGAEDSGSGTAGSGTAAETDLGEPEAGSAL